MSAACVHRQVLDDCLLSADALQLFLSNCEQQKRTLCKYCKIYMLASKVPHMLQGTGISLHADLFTIQHLTPHAH